MRMLATMFLAVLSNSASAADLSFSYSVPVAPRLERFAQFPLANASWDPEAAQGAHLSFDLPDYLVGRRRVHIELNQAGPQADDGSLKLEGDIAHSTCTPTEAETETSTEIATAESYRCRIEYNDLPHYGRGVAWHLYFRDPFHYFQRRAVAQAFSADPIGFVTIAPASR